jgi:hypothetical protein
MAGGESCDEHSCRRGAVGADTARAAPGRGDRAATLYVLYDRFVHLLLPGGAAVLVLVGLLALDRRRAFVGRVWLGLVTGWTLWTANRHLVEAYAYGPILAAASLCAAQGASAILEKTRRGLVVANVGWLVVIGLIFAEWWHYGDAFHRLYRWNAAVVGDRDGVPPSWIETLRAHGARYFVAEAHVPGEIRDQRFLRAMTREYGFRIAYNRVVFPIAHGPADRLPGSSSGPGPLLVFEAEELPTRVGRIVPDAGAGNGYAVRGDRAGMVVFRPYEVYPPGAYLAEYRVRVAPGLGGTVGHVDVAVDGGRRLLARQELSAAPGTPPGYRSVTLVFALARSERVELRVYAQGPTPIWVDGIRLRPAGVAR